MKKVILAILLVSAIVLVSTCAERKEGYCRLRYQAIDTSESTIYYACQDQFKLSEKPAQLKDLPEKISNRVNYFLAKIAGREIPLIIDRGNKSKLYLDTDSDGCLSDEKGFTSKTVKKVCLALWITTDSARHFRLRQPHDRAGTLSLLVVHF